MYIFQRGQVLGGGKPGPRFYYPNDSGVLTNLYALSFQVFDVSDDAKKAMPLQVYPATPGDKQAVVVGTDAPTGDRDGTGRYTARWTVPTTEAVGLHEVRWFWQETSTSTEQTARQPFDVVEVAVPRFTVLALPSDLRAEGVCATGPAGVSTLRVLAGLAAASTYIERYTRRRFSAQYQALDVDGIHANGLPLPTATPIVGVEQIQYREAYYSLGEFVSSGSTYRIYNRHLRGMVHPDDRDNPRIEIFDFTHDASRAVLLGGYTFPEGRQNIRVLGVFGYTEPDDTPFGGVPPLVRDAAMRLAMRNLPKAASGEQAAARMAASVKREKTREQEVEYGFDTDNAAFVGKITGDPAVDQVLAMYRAPMGMGAA